MWRSHRTAVAIDGQVRLILLMTFFYITILVTKMMVISLLLPVTMHSVVYSADNGSPGELGTAHP